MLSGTLHQMMVATLNQMPDEPTDFMKEYIKLHYSNWQGRDTKTPTPRTQAKITER